MSKGGQKMSDMFVKMFNVCATPHCKENRQPEKDFCKFCAQKHAEEDEWALAQRKGEERRRAALLMPSSTTGTLSVATQDKIDKKRKEHAEERRILEKCDRSQLEKVLAHKRGEI
jgi:hypothetical protein